MGFIIRLCCGLCLALFLIILMWIDENDKKKREEANKHTYKNIKRNNKQNTITIKSIY